MKQPSQAGCALRFCSGCTGQEYESISYVKVYATVVLSSSDRRIWFERSRIGPELKVLGREDGSWRLWLGPIRCIHGQQTGSYKSTANPQTVREGLSGAHPGSVIFSALLQSKLLTYSRRSRLVCSYANMRIFPTSLFDKHLATRIEV